MRTRLTLLIFLVAIIAPGCSRVLDLSPENSLTYRNGLVKESDFEAALRGAAQLLAHEVRDVHILQPLKGEYADEEDGVLQERYLSPENIRDASWSLHYALIAQANIVLKYLSDASFSAERKNIYRGQALFYKGIAYFELIRQFGDCVLVREEVDPVPQPKTNWVSVADHAIQLTEEASRLLPEQNELWHSDGTAANKTVPSRGAAFSLLAHLSAWKAGCKYFAEDPSYDDTELWQKVTEYTSAVINSGMYQLAPDPQAVVDQVLAGSVSESIFESAFRNLWHEMTAVEQSSPYLTASYYQRYPVAPGTSLSDHGLLRISNHSVERFFPEGDLRRSAYFYNFAELSDTALNPVTGGFAYPYKYKEILKATGGWFSGQMINFNVNKVWWRLADIILLRAEAKSRTGNIAGAVADLNIVRMRAKATPYNAAEHNGNLRYTIFKEREKELLMEGHRYYDVIRNGYARTELQGNFRTASDLDFRDGAFFLYLTRQGNPNDYDNNPYMVPNKYWSRFY